jgi:hypothetical protein
MAHLYSTMISSLALPCVAILTQSHFWRLYQEFRGSPSNSVFAPAAFEVFAKVRRLLQYAYDHTANRDEVNSLVNILHFLNRILG